MSNFLRLKINFIVVGKIKGSIWQEPWEFYKKRLFWEINLKELTHENSETSRKRETDKILAAVPKNVIVWALTEYGKNLSSLDFAEKLKDLSLAGTNELSLIIGGAQGFDERILNLAQEQIAFGKATWPHLCARVLTLEQIYRAQQILVGHPYHNLNL